ncbi:MAG: UDP-N-acetylmuramoyl-L-alanyl-D-glutamate--2,6-diaminopimelate ligase [Alphaproteobacteria bacterium]
MSQTGTDSLNITGLAAHSQSVQPGFLFAALKSEKNSEKHGQSYIRDALNRGAIAVLAGRGSQTDIKVGSAALVPDVGSAVLILDDAPRRCLAEMAARFHHPFPEYKIAVTGTDGKTSICWIAHNLLKLALGKPVGYVGTLGTHPQLKVEQSSLTTPDPITLAAQLGEMKRRGVEYVAIEASSHGLAQDRLSGFLFNATCFTGLGEDHADYHTSEQDYLRAKSRLFTERLAEGAVAILCYGSKGGEDIAELLKAERPDLSVLRYQTHKDSTENSNIDNRVEKFRHVGEGAEVTLRLGARTHSLVAPIYAEFQAQNLLAALLLAASGSDVELSDLLRVVDSLKSVPGRLERIPLPSALSPAHRLRSCEFFVDFAHTPQAVAATLRALVARRTAMDAGGRLIAVLGAGGNRDVDKRSQMGQAAALLADKVIITDDNPRNEDPAAIRAAILKGAANVNVNATEISSSRKDAIAYALASMQDNDTLAILGKGHESTQEINGVFHPFNDAAVLNEALNELLAQEAAK